MIKKTVTMRVLLHILLLLGTVCCGLAGAAGTPVGVTGFGTAAEQNATQTTNRPPTGGLTTGVTGSGRAADPNLLPVTTRPTTGASTPGASTPVSSTSGSSTSGSSTSGSSTSGSSTSGSSTSGSSTSGGSTSGGSTSGGSTSGSSTSGSGKTGDPNTYRQSIGNHLDKKNLPLTCATCHFRGNLKSGGGSAGCITCHGNPQRKTGNSKMPKGAVTGVAGLTNIEAEFSKTFRHPTFDTPGLHKPNEILPEVDVKAFRHADCVDCHNPHFVTRENRFAGIKGKRIVNQVSDVTKEAELCYRCHGDSVNLPGKYTNKRLEFSLNSPSYHPVEGEGKNLTVVSLIRPYREKKVDVADISVISCGDCHGNDDADGPKGVHGSRNRFILKDNFDASDNIPESSYAYALCYRCHSRTSILANESFRYHSLHIEGKSLVASGTSCFTCHNSHGSVDAKYLIRFNRMIVSPNSKGLLKFVEKGSAKFSGECYLSCHGVEHDPKSY